MNSWSTERSKVGTQLYNSACRLIQETNVMSPVIRTPRTQQRDMCQYCLRAGWIWQQVIYLWGQTSVSDRLKHKSGCMPHGFRVFLDFLCSPISCSRFFAFSCRVSSCVNVTESYARRIAGMESMFFQKGTQSVQKTLIVLTSRSITRKYDYTGKSYEKVDETIKY